jgi:hypothetical protein
MGKLNKASHEFHGFHKQIGFVQGPKARPALSVISGIRGKLFLCLSIMYGP